MRIEPNKLYIDRRLGINPEAPHEELLGSEWIKRGTSEYWLVPVEPNENGFLIEQDRKE